MTHESLVHAGIVNQYRRHMRWDEFRVMTHDSWDHLEIYISRVGLEFTHRPCNIFLEFD